LQTQQPENAQALVLLVNKIIQAFAKNQKINASSLSSSPSASSSSPPLVFPWQAKIRSIASDTLCFARALHTSARQARSISLNPVPIANNREAVLLIREGLTILINNQEALGGHAYVGGQGQLQIDIKNAFNLLEATESLSQLWQQGINADGMVQVEWNSQLVDLLVVVIGEVLNVQQCHFVRGNPPPPPLPRMRLEFPPTATVQTQATVDVVWAEGYHYDCLLPGQLLTPVHDSLHIIRHHNSHLFTNDTFSPCPRD